MATKINSWKIWFIYCLFSWRIFLLIFCWVFFFGYLKTLSTWNFLLLIIFAVFFEEFMFKCVCRDIYYEFLFFFFKWMNEWNIFNFFGDSWCKQISCSFTFIVVHRNRDTCRVSGAKEIVVPMLLLCRSRILIKDWVLHILWRTRSFKENSSSDRHYLSFVELFLTWLSKAS